MKQSLKTTVLLLVCSLLQACTGSSGEFTPGLKQGKVELSDHAVAYLYLPDTAAPYPVVIDLHGCNGRWPQRDREWIPFFLEQNMAVLQVDSFEKRGVDNICDDVYRVRAMDRTFDAAEAVRFVLSNKQFNHQALFLAGMSHGGTTALLSNLSSSRIFSKLQGVIVYYPYCLDVLPVLNSDLLILIGAQDDWTPAMRCSRMRVLNRQQHEMFVQIYPDAYHSFDVPGLNETYYGHQVRYNQQAADASRQRVKAFISQRLQ